MSKEALTPLQQGTLDILRERMPGIPITGKEIAGLIGLKPRKSGKEGADMRSILHALRVKGYPICASGEGYWWPASKEELKGYINSFQARVDDQQAAVDGMREGLGKFGMPEKVKVVPLVYYYRVPGNPSVIQVASEKEALFKSQFPNAQKL